MKKLSTLLLVLLMLAALAVPAVAAGEPYYLIDGADLLTPSQEKDLEEKLADISKEWDMDIVVVTADDLEGASSTAFADDFYVAVLRVHRRRGVPHSRGGEHRLLPASC